MRVFSAPYAENRPGGITTALLGRTEMQLEVVGFQ